MTSLFKKYWPIIFSALLYIAAVSCTNPFAPPEIPITRAGHIAAQIDPDSTLANFRLAYENRDLDIYENCLDVNFVFIYIDQTRTGEVERVSVPRDGTSGDLARTKALFKAFDAISLDTWNVITLPDTVTAEGTIKKRRVIFHLVVKDLSGNFNYEQLEASGFALFTFRQSRIDGLWRIVTWEDQSII